MKNMWGAGVETNEVFGRVKGMEFSCLGTKKA